MLKAVVIAEKTMAKKTSKKPAAVALQPCGDAANSLAEDRAFIDKMGPDYFKRLDARCEEMRRSIPHMKARGMLRGSSLRDLCARIDEFVNHDLPKRRMFGDTYLALIAGYKDRLTAAGFRKKSKK